MPTLQKEWAKEKDACFIYSIGKHKLHEIVEAGYVRVQGGGKVGADRRYKCEDIDRYLTRDAAGRGQMKVRGRI
ncbi:MAG: hypothetical protein NE327_21100 [Lentisphaeraceae bacterium]|nr:hypothetical protein [Lentisphaeraceae bacterium]